MMCDSPPLLVLVSGWPGSGKTDLARRLASAERLALPLLSRDAIKAGLVETLAYASPDDPREVIESDQRRERIAPASFDVFYDTIDRWLRSGVSLIAKFGFGPRDEPLLRRMVALARTALVECVVSEEIARERYEARERADPRHRPDRLAAALHRGRGEYPWANAELALPVPRIRVTTTDGYDPALEAVVAFCLRVARGD